MRDIYLAVAERLRAKVPEILYVDLDSGQIDANTPPPVEFPCALIDLEFSRCEDESTKIQVCDVKITVRVAFEAWMDETSSLTPDTWRNKALAKMELPDRVFCALQGWGTDGLSSLSRSSVRPERRSDGLKAWRVEFTTTLEDHAE